LAFCGELIINLRIPTYKNYYLRDDTQKQQFRDAGAHEDKDKCCAVVGDGARWAVELILSEIESRGLTIEDFKDLQYP
jgi:hypothetical protein